MPPPDGPRPLIIGEESGPEAPFPLRMGGKVVSGFGRGSKELGIPTANIPVEGVSWMEDAKSGVYFGWAGIQLPPSHPNLEKLTSGASTKFTDASTTALVCPVSPPASSLEAGWRLYPMVMSIGYNPFYKNTVRSAEVHVMHKFEKNFYGLEMRISILGWIRPEYDYVSLDALVEDIKTDIEVSGRSLARPGWGPKDAKGGGDGYLWGEEV